jgi:hypothetical protein
MDMNILANQNGASRFKVYLWFLVLFLVVHVAVKLIPVYMDYYRMEDEMKAKASVSQVLKDENPERSGKQGKGTRPASHPGQFCHQKRHGQTQNENQHKRRMNIR